MKKIKFLIITFATVLFLSACGGNKDTTREVDSTNSVAPITNNAPTASEDENTEMLVVTDEMRTEADKLWSDFLNKVSVIETDDKYSSILKIIENTANFYAKYYEETTGRSGDEYLNMSSFEQFLWQSVYIFPYLGTTASGYDTYLGSIVKWNSNTVGASCGLLESYGTPEMEEAYLTLMEWDYYFLMKTGCVYNFIEGQTSAETNPNYVILDPSLRHTEEAEQAQQELLELQEELQNENN